MGQASLITGGKYNKSMRISTSIWPSMMARQFKVRLKPLPQRRFSFCGSSLALAIKGVLIRTAAGIPQLPPPPERPADLIMHLV